jgi:5-methylcytosine-specific restriction endonuclease McrA
MKEYRKANRKIIRAKTRVRQAAKRAAAIAIYGGRCTKCGMADGLEFDHVNGDGAGHRKDEPVQKLHRRIVAAGKPISDHELQLLCADCHRAKTIPELRIAGALGGRGRHASSG